MNSYEIEVNGESITVEQGDVFDVNSTLEFGMGRTFENGDIVTVDDITKYPDGIHFIFTVEGEPGRTETIMAFALELNLENKYMSVR